MERGDHMSSPSAVDAFPGFVALDALAVLEGERPGASVQLTEGYLHGQQRMLEAIDRPDVTDDRVDTCQESRRIWGDLHVDIGSRTEGNLQEASTRLRDLLRGLPEVRYLRDRYPETCFVVPEWLRTPGEVQYGARVYFFADEAPAPDEILDRNIRAVLDESPGAFDRYLGSLHGYPECCVDYYAGAKRSPAAESPEARSIAPLADIVDEERVHGGAPSSSSVTEILPGFFERPQSYAFFAHAFYPEPECDAARRTGISIYETLAESLPESLVRDYFRVNFGWSYLLERSARRRVDCVPEPGAFGREHALLYLPLQILLETGVY
ncbi:hypothetical protein DJ73_16425 [Halorubrum sp. Ea1]|nr:hypothetical protein DJ73_16425 [Halorubrum sp. Ea1]